MEAAERLTVVIPTFDRPGYFDECLGSVADQSCTGFRLVVLDNASPSDYSSVLDKYTDVSFQYVRNAIPRPGGNIVTAMREYADTDYLTVFHDDDMMHPRMLELQLELLEADPALQFVATEFAMFVDSDVSPRDAWDGLQPAMEIYDDVAALARALLGGAELCFGSTMYRSSVLRKIDFDAARFSIYCDRPYLMDAARQGRCALIKAPLVLYRVHPGQDTNMGSLGVGNLIELMKAYREALSKDWDRADQELFYQHSRRFLVNNQGYGHLAASRRHGAISFLWRSWANGVVRLRDFRLSDFATLARMDGWDRQVDAALAAKQWLSRRRCPGVGHDEVGSPLSRRSRPDNTVSGRLAQRRGGMPSSSFSPEVFVLDVDDAPFTENCAFDLEHARQYPGAESGALLGEVMRARGLETVTADVYLNGPLRSRPAVCASVELTRFTDELLGLDHVDPAVCISLESPIVARGFYSSIGEVSQRFRHLFLWRGARERATGGAQFHEVHWPYADLTPTVGALPWEQRRFLTLVNSNKRVFAFPRPLFQAQHPRHSLRLLLAAMRVQWARSRERWFLSELYKERLAAIRQFAQRPDFDLYGYGWGDVSGLSAGDARAVSRSYRGELPHFGKIEALWRYKFAICFENTAFPGYVTEKVFDALVAGCIPVYLGAPDIEEYVPADALVDARRFRNYGELEKCLREMTSGEADRRLAAARAFLGSDAAAPFRQRRHVEEIAAALIGDPV